jgi:subtilisin-like proprotein convertase family protein
MPAANYNFLIEQGSKFDINFLYLDDDNNPVDLTGKCIVLRWLDSNNKIYTFSSATTASLSNASGYSLTGDNIGNILFSISASQTKTFNFTTAVYDLDIVETIDGVIQNTRVLTGTIGLVIRNFSIVENCGLINADPSIPLLNDSSVVVTTTPEPTAPVITPTPTVEVETDLCLPEDCIALDIFSQVYVGSGMNILDYQNNSNTITVSNTGIIENVEVAINGLRHSNAQDLALVLLPPSGSGILMSFNSKINNYIPGFSFMFSNRAPSGNYLYNTANGGLCNILNKTNIYNLNGSGLTYSFDHLFNSSLTGLWTLYANDTDIGTSGTIDSWKLILTYQNPDEGLSE